MKKSFFTLCTILLCLFSMMSYSCVVMNAVGEITSVIGEVTENPILASAGKATSSVATASSPISSKQEYYIGRSVATSILAEYNVHYNPPLTEYVNKVCYVLGINSEYEQLYRGRYFVTILDTPQVNAFATSGGHIFITLGLLSCAETEDALAAVLAHEISHIQLKHGIKSIKSDRWTKAALASADVTVKSLSKDEQAEIINGFSESVENMVSTMINTGYSQSQEFEADLIALKLMNSAGYNPYAMTEMLARLQEEQSKSSDGFAKTHPSAKDRLNKVHRELKKYEEISVPEIRKQRLAKANKK